MRLQELGAEVVIGDLLNLNDVRLAGSVARHYLPGRTRSCAATRLEQFAKIFYCLLVFANRQLPRMVEIASLPNAENQLGDSHLQCDAIATQGQGSSALRQAPWGEET
jgi:hypothetical protein